MDIKDQIKIATSNPWEARSDYAQRNLGKSNEVADPSSKELDSLLKFFGIKIDLQDTDASYQAVDGLINQKIDEVFASKIKVGSRNQVINSQHNNKLASRYYGPINNKKQYHSNRKTLGTLVNFVNQTTKAKPDREDTEFEGCHHGEFRNGVASGLGIRKHKDGSIVIGNFVNGSVKSNILRLYPKAGISHNAKTSVLKKDREKLSQSSKDSGELSFMEANLADKESLTISPQGLAFQGLLDAKYNRTEGKLLQFLGRVFEGKFINNLPSEGQLTNVHSIKEAGSFSVENSFINGPGVKKYRNGASVKGNWDHGIPNGNFEIKFSNGLILHINLNRETDLSHKQQVKIVDPSSKYEFHGFIKVATNNNDKPSKVYLDDYFATRELTPIGEASLKKPDSSRALLLNFYTSGKLKTIHIANKDEVSVVEKSKKLFGTKFNFTENSPLKIFRPELKNLNRETIILNPLQKEIASKFAWTKDIMPGEQASAMYKRLVGIIEAKYEALKNEVKLIEQGSDKYKKHVIEDSDKNNSVTYYNKKYQKPHQDPLAINIGKDKETGEVTIIQGKVNKNCETHDKQALGYNIMSDGTIEDISYGSYSNGYVNGEDCILYDPIAQSMLKGLCKKGDFIHAVIVKPGGEFSKVKIKTMKNPTTRQRERCRQGIFTDKVDKCYIHGTISEANEEFFGELLFYNKVGFLDMTCSSYEDLLDNGTRKHILEAGGQTYFALIKDDNGNAVLNSRFSLYSISQAFEGTITKTKKDLKDLLTLVNPLKYFTKSEFDIKGMLKAFLCINAKGTFTFPNGATASGTVIENNLHDKDAKLCVFTEEGDPIELSANYEEGKLQNFKHQTDYSDDQIRKLIELNFGDELDILNSLFSTEALNSLSNESTAAGTELKKTMTEIIKYFSQGLKND